MNTATASRQRIAIIGSGISGLTAAYVLHPHHEITVFENNTRIGGHTATVDVTMPDGESHAIDTGFIVYNEWTYPNFIKLLGRLGIQRKPSEMSFSVRNEIAGKHYGLEYSGNNLDTLFCQRRNIIRPSFLRMVRDILRFNREAIMHLNDGSLQEDLSLGDYLRKHRYSPEFIEHYLVPMGSAIWSASTRTMLEFPPLFFVRFFKNHGLLSVNDRPTWFVIPGGSREYLAPLTASFADRIHTQAGVQSVQRHPDHVVVQTGKGHERFDQVIFACHSDEALQLLGTDASKPERDILGALPYQANDVVLHTDTQLLPRHRKAWASWNYQLTANDMQHAILTYNMNILQGIESRHTFCVTLNHTQAIAPQHILGRYRYSHPVFTIAGIRAQQRWQEINGNTRSWFCGAYWRNGFHEDGVWSALRVAEAFGGKL